MDNRLVCLGLLAVLFLSLSVGGSGPEFVPGELLVKFKESPGIQAASVNREFSVLSMERLFRDSRDKISQAAKDESGLDRIYKLRLADDADVRAVAREYGKNPLVEYAEPNYIHHTRAVPNDARYPEQWAHRNMQSELAWEIEEGSGDVIIAIVDTGVMWSHPDLASNIWNNTDEIAGNGIDDDNNGFIDDVRGYDFVNNSNSSECPAGEDCFDEDNDPMDFHGHGTHCAGIAAGVTNNSLGIAGLCRNCTIMPVRAGHSGTLETDDAAQAIVYAADNGADVISMSFGSSYPSSTEKDAIDYAYDKGAVLVAAAGNDDWDADDYPTSYWNVISVAATDSNDVKASFSSYGSWTEVAAPGVDILSTYTGEGRDAGLSIIPTGMELEANGFEYSALTPEGGLVGNLLHASLGYEENFTSQNFTGKIAIIERGEFTFQDKVQNAYETGAVGVVVYNNEPGIFSPTLSNQSMIPAVFISREDGQYLLELMENGTVTVNMSVTEQDYAPMSGTSMACPHVSGLAGLILSKNPDLSQEEVRTIIRSTTDNVSSDKYIGTGRINAYRALQRNTRVIASLDSSLDYVAVGGVINITGTANGTDFRNYGLYYGEGIYPENWTLIESSTSAVDNGTLAIWDISSVAGGTHYSIRLVVFDTEDQLSEYMTLTSTTYSCRNCSECSEMIQNAHHGDMLYLTANITGQSGTCIKVNDTHAITLDCQGNSIEGMSEGRGAYINGGLNNIIKNCRISRFECGIHLDYSDDNTIIDNTLDNNDYGIYLDHSDYNTITRNTLNKSRGQEGLVVTGYFKNNITASNTVNGLPVQYYDGTYRECPDNEVLSFNLSEQNISHLQLVGCDNVTIRNLNTTLLDGIYLSHTDNSRIEDCVSNENNYGVYVDGSENNTLTGNTANSNADYGIYLGYSSGNALDSNQFCSNTVSDLYLSSGSGNSGNGNICDKTYAWNDSETTGCTYSCTGCLKGDADCDGTVSDFELLDYMGDWTEGTVGDLDLLDAIDKWVSG